ncbi:stalk domain-containing protein [Cohnella sp. WQ 127256]|uniref:stalk domain-containing protein n=1 Tax=Cohnella sp. WQ 127256 TaxID=2938790 RepID=UPI0021190821|nr:stalk domain-containing protein [Cohnella sp. WQ 127256]
MRNNIRTIGLLTLGLSLIVPSVALAATDTNWTKSSELYEIRTWTGQSQWGHVDGPVKSATLFHPRSIVELPNGKLLVADTENHMLREISVDAVTTYSGLFVGESESRTPIGAYNDDQLNLAAYNQPTGLTVDSLGNIYIADSGNNAIRKITKDGKVNTLAGNGSIGNKDAKGKEATFYSPSDIAVDSKGTVYVSDTLNHTIRKITPEGVVTTLTASSNRAIEYFPGAAEFAGDYADGAIANAKFNEPSGLAVDGNDNLYVSDRGNQRIRYIDFTKGTVTTVAGGKSSDNGTSIYTKNSAYALGDFLDGAAVESKFNAPEGLALTEDGSLIVADSLNHAIRIIQDGKVTTLTGIPVEFGVADGLTNHAQFNHPTDVTVLKDGRLVIVDESGNKIRVLQKYAKPASMPSDKSISVLLNGKIVSSDVPAQLKSNAVLLPVRSVGAALGYKVSFDKKTGAAILTKGETTYTIKSGANTVTKSVKGVKQTLTLNAPVAEVDKRVFIPVRFFANESGLDIQWDAENQTVVIRNVVFNSGL